MPRFKHIALVQQQS